MAVLTARGTLIAGILAAMGASECCVALLGLLAVPLAAPLLY